MREFGANRRRAVRDQLERELQTASGGIDSGARNEYVREGLFGLHATVVRPREQRRPRSQWPVISSATWYAGAPEDALDRPSPGRRLMAVARRWPTPARILNSPASPPCRVTVSSSRARET